MPRKIRELIAEIEAAGYRQVTGGKGSHRKFRHADIPGSITISGRSGGDAKPYQEREVRRAVAAAAAARTSQRQTTERGPVEEGGAEDERNDAN